MPLPRLSAPLALAVGLLAAGALACHDSPSAPSPYSAALLAGQWKKDVACPFYGGNVYEFDLTASDSAGRTVVHGFEYLYRCGDLAFLGVPVSATYRPRGNAVHLESAPICCTYVHGTAEEFVSRADGQFTDSNTVRVVLANYVGAEAISVPDTFALARQP